MKDSRLWPRPTFSEGFYRLGDNLWDCKPLSCHYCHRRAKVRVEKALYCTHCWNQIDFEGVKNGRYKISPVAA